MASQPPDINELIRLLLQQQQMQQQRPAPQQSQQIQLQPLAPNNTGTGALGLLEGLLLEYINKLSSAPVAAPAGCAPFQATANAPVAAAQPNPTAVNSLPQQQQQLLSTARQLESINPSLSASVVSYAMSLGQAQMQPQYHPLPSNAASSSTSSQQNANVPSSDLSSSIIPHQQDVRAESTSSSAKGTVDCGKIPAVEHLSLRTLQKWSLEELGEDFE